LTGKTTSSIIVSVRFTEADLRKLQLFGPSLWAFSRQLIRDATDKHIKKLTSTKEFKTKGLRLQRQNENVAEFLEAAEYQIQ